MKHDRDQGTAEETTTKNLLQSAELRRGEEQACAGT